MITANGGLTVGAGSTVDMGGNQVHNVADGTAPGDAVNYGQLSTVSSSASTGIASLSTGLSTTNSNVASLSTGLSTTNSNVASLSTALSTTDSTVASLSTSTSTGLSSLSTGLSTTNSAVSSLSTGVANNAEQINNIYNALSTVQNTVNNNASNPLFAADGDRNTEAATASGSHATAMGANAVAAADNSTAIGAGAQVKAPATNAVALGANSVADRANTVSVGSAGNERQITNVAAGTAGTDAVNVDQLNKTVTSAVGTLPTGMSGKDYTDQQIAAVQSGVNQVAKNAYSGVAAATALAMVPEVEKDKTVSFGVGGASYKGSSAVAAKLSVRITENLKFSAGVGSSSNGTTYGAGAAYQW
jgi:trimeric autotransporter adhesin